MMLWRIKRKMTDEEMLNKIIKKSTENVFEILKANGFEIKEKKSIFQRTEQLLYLMPQLKEAINHNKNKIKDLQQYGVEKKGGAVHVAPTTIPIKLDEEEIIQKEINKLLQRNYIINSQIKWVNGILQTIKNDKFYEIIELKYFKNKTQEEIAEYFECDERTIRRNKNKIINNLKVLLFPNDSIDELGN